MPKLVYGVWDGTVYDNRNGGDAQPPNVDLSMFDNFNDGNPARAILSHRGFLVFDPDLPLLWALGQHFDKVASESCGKCSPCRTGAPLLRDALFEAGEGGEVDWGEIVDIANQMHKTSLCGIGKTGPAPLLDAITYFTGELKPGEKAEKSQFFSAMTSPCIEACPGLVNIPRYIDYIKDGHEDLAANTVLRHYPLVGSCGRVCVRSCESACRRA